MLTRVKTEFALSLPITFRRTADDSWLSGQTERISSTRVRFQTSEWIEQDSRIEMVFRMPVPDPCDVVCSGSVLEVGPPTGDPALRVISATIDRYTFVRL
jgi:hypothetical protein